MSIFRDLAAWRPLGVQTQARMAKHDIVCLHTMVGNLTGTDVMFRKNGYHGTESHFGIGGPWGDGLDGVVYQWQDTAFRADANLDGNHRVISIETGDNAPKAAADLKPWSEKQLDAIVRVTARMCKAYDIPAVLLPDSGPGRRGIAYHRLGVQHSGGTHPDGFLQPGCERWSTAVGKECPGPARIAQMPEIVRRVRAALAPAKPQEVDMAFEAKDVWNVDHKLTDSDAKAYGGETKAGDVKSYEEMLRFPPAVARLRRETDERLKGIESDLADIKALLTPPTTGA